MLKSNIKIVVFSQLYFSFFLSQFFLSNSYLCGVSYFGNVEDMDV